MRAGYEKHSRRIGSPLSCSKRKARKASFLGSTPQ
jgi:hypothetical protein